MATVVSEGRHWLLFDGDCGICRRLVKWLLGERGETQFKAVAYQEAPTPPMTPELATACERAMHVIDTNGRTWRGSQAVLFVLQRTRGGALYRILAAPPLAWLSEVAYRLFASNRPFFARLFMRDR